MSNSAIIFRRSQFNRYSLPLLMGIVEKASKNIPIYLLDSIDYLADFKKIYKRIILAYSFTTLQMMKVYEEIREIKIRFNDIYFIAGGPHATADPEGTLALGFNTVFVGEGERTLTDFTYLVEKGGELPDGEIINDNNQEPVSIDDYYPVCHRHNLCGPMEITRGCFYNCHFCQTPRLFRKTIRHRSIESVIRGIEKADHYNGQRLYFLSPNAFSYQAKRAGEINYEAIEELLKSVKECGVKDLDIAYFPSEIRPECINEQTLELLEKYCSNKKIAIGIQSGSKPVLKRTCRTSGIEIPLNAVALARSRGFTSHCDFIFGFPDETQEEVDESIEIMTLLIKKYDARIHCHFFMPLPMTPLWNSTPTHLSEKTKNILNKMRNWGKLDGWWEEQEIESFNIIEWKKLGFIKV